MIRNFKRLALVAGLSFFVTGCATYQGEVSAGRQKLQSGQIDQALEDFKKLAEKENGDQLVHLMDYGTALQYAGKFEESNRVFLKADKLAEMNDYHSVSRVAGSLLTSEEMVQYKGDTFEQIFINAMLALNYTREGNIDDALVEARRINEKYQKLRQDDKKKFELNPFSKYLAGVLWEASKNYDEAYLSYKEAYDLNLGSPILQDDLLRSANLARRDQDFQEWAEKFPDAAKRFKKPVKSDGELVVFFLQGWGPRKQPDPSARTFPILVHVPSEVSGLSVTVSPEKGELEKKRTELLYNVEQAAIQTLREDRGLLVAKRVGGVVAKEVVADQIRQKNQTLGALAWIGMYASDRADLRQWSTLPQTIQMTRIPLSAGKYHVSANSLSNAGGVLEELSQQDIQVKAGKKYFLILRSLK